jgi:two-component system chemotaxis response regulator CheY
VSCLVVEADYTLAPGPIFGVHFTQRFDLLLVDVNMPKMDGYTLLRELRKRPELWSIPAIMVTTEDKAEDLRRAYGAGASFHLSKPFDPELLRRSVVLLLGEGA